MMGWEKLCRNGIASVLLKNYHNLKETLKEEGLRRECVTEPFKGWTDLIRSFPNAPLFGSAAQQPSIFPSRAPYEQNRAIETSVTLCAFRSVIFFLVIVPLLNHISGTVWFAGWLNSVGIVAQFFTKNGSMLCGLDKNAQFLTPNVQSATWTS